MALPAIIQVLGAVGFLGGRELVRGRQAQQRVAAGNELLDSYSAAGLVEDEALAELRQLNAYDPGMAQTALQNITKGTFDRNKLAADTQYRNADLGMRRDMLTLQQGNADLAREKFQFQQDTTARQRGEFQMALENPAMAEQLAFREGKDVFPVRTEDGSLAYVPTQGSKQYRDDVTGFGANVRGLEILNEMIGLVQSEGFLTNPRSPETQRYRSLRGQLTAVMKDGLELGALDEGVQNLVDSIAIDASSIRNNLLSSPEAVISGLAEASGLFRNNIEQQGRAMRHHRGIDPALVQRTQANLQRHGNILDTLSQIQAAENTPTPNPLASNRAAPGTMITFPEVERRARMVGASLTGDEAELRALQELGQQEFLGGVGMDLLTGEGVNAYNAIRRLF